MCGARFDELSTDYPSDQGLSGIDVGGPNHDGGMTDAVNDTPGPADAARLEAIVDGIVDCRRRIAALQAEEAMLLTEAQAWALSRMDAPSLDTERPRDIPLRSVAAEIGAATRTSDRTVQARMASADQLVVRFPATHADLAAGAIDRSHASVIVEAGTAIDDDEARGAYEASVLTVARRETPGRLRPVARSLAYRVHPVPTPERHRRARAIRRVWVRDLDDGMAEIGGVVDAVLAHGIHDRLTQVARAVVEARRTTRDDELHGFESESVSDTRRIDELRADVFCDLLLTGHATAEESDASVPASSAIRARVQITVPVLSLLGVDAAPADLAGCGPIDPEVARRLAAAAPGWDRVLTEPVGGAVLGRPLPADRAAASSSRGARRALPCARMQAGGAPVRHRPHDRARPRRTDERRQPRAPVPTTSHSQAPLRVASATASRRGHGMDEPVGTHLCGCARPHSRLRARCACHGPRCTYLRARAGARRAVLKPTAPF